MTADGGWTVAEAVAWLDPPITPTTLNHLIKAADLTPTGYRKPRAGSAGGRPAAVYSIGALMDLHADHIRWLIRREKPAASLDSPACRTILA